MTVLSFPDVSRRSGLSEPTLRNYERVGPGHRGDCAAQADARRRVVETGRQLAVRR